jgi:arylsulfatase A-like enzyme
MKFLRYLVIGLGLCACVVEQEPNDRPDVLLVVLDTVRADRLSAYGHERLTSPYVDGLAEGAGVLFEDCTAPAAWTWPSHASLFTGELPWVHGAHLSLDPPDGTGFIRKGLMLRRMREDLPTLAERFSEVGYRTVSLSQNVWLSPELGLMRGFDDAHIFHEKEEFVTRARAVLAEKTDRPLFLLLNFATAHGPYLETDAPWLAAHDRDLNPETAPDWVRPYLLEGEPRGVDLASRPEGHMITGFHRYLMGRLQIPPEGFELLFDLYDGEVSVADRLFGAVFQTWGQQRPESVVVVTSDHGELFGEHELIEHRGSVYPELLQVPLVIAAPGRLPTGVRIETPVQLQDVYPTLLDLAGIEDAPKGSLIPVIEGKPREGPILAAAWPSNIWARLGGDRFSHIWHLYRVGDEALLWNSGGGAELYDLEKDPWMRRDLSAERGERIATLRREAEPFFPPEVHTESASNLLSDRAKEQLRELGYAVD